MNMKKLVSLFLIIAALASLSVVASADGEDSTSVIPNAVTPVEDHSEPNPGDGEQEGTGEDNTEQTDSGNTGSSESATPPISTVFAITKHPYSESIEEGSVTSFLSKATGAASATWIIQDANGNPATSALISVKDTYVNESGELVAKGTEGINGLMLSNAMHLSAFLEKKVEIPFDEELYYSELMKRVATSRRKTDVKAVFADTAGSYGGNK